MIMTMTMTISMIKYNGNDEDNYDAYNDKHDDNDDVPSHDNGVTYTEHLLQAYHASKHQVSLHWTETA